jgi:hypothetical protein
MCYFSCNNQSVQQRSGVKTIMQPNNVPERANKREKGVTAEYIADLCRDLAHMARGERFDTLAYLLDMACLEAETVGRQYEPTGSSTFGR